MGQERFNLLFNRNEPDFVPGLFEPERIRNFRKFDCGYASFEELKGYSGPAANPEMIQSVDRAKFVGDKSISLWRNFAIFDAPAWENQSVRVFHIVRDVTEVAASYQNRFDNPNDQWTADFQKGVDVWSHSVIRAHQWMKSEIGKGHRAKLSIVSYEALFEGDEAAFMSGCGKIFTSAGFDFDNSHLEGPRKVFCASQEAQQRRVISDEFRTRIGSIVNLETYQKFKQLEQMSIL